MQAEHPPRRLGSSHSYARAWRLDSPSSGRGPSYDAPDPHPNSYANTYPHAATPRSGADPYTTAEHAKTQRLSDPFGAGRYGPRAKPAYRASTERSCVVPKEATECDFDPRAKEIPQVLEN